MSLLRFLGKRYIEKVGVWAPTAATFGATAAAGLVYATDWKLILQYVPYINGKFKSEE